MNTLDYFTQSFESNDLDFKKEEPVDILSYLDWEQKMNLQDMIKNRVRPFLISYSKKISKEIDTILNEPIERYYNNLLDSWNQHIRVNQEADNFIYFNSLNSNNSWWLEVWEYVRKILILLYDTDHKKTLYSSWIKTKASSKFDELNINWDYTKDRDIILKGNQMSFHSIYYLEHLDYYLSPDLNKLKFLVKKYHCSDEKLFELRLKLFWFDKQNKLNLEKIYSSLFDNNSNYSNDRFDYLSKLPSDFKIIWDLIWFDNYTEYLYIYSFKWFPDIFFRELVLKKLKELWFFLDVEEVLSLDKEDFLIVIDNVISQCRENFKLPIEPYLQSNWYTCWTACVLMALKFYKWVNVDKNLEFDIWSKVWKPRNFTGWMSLILNEYWLNSKYIRNNDQLFSDNYRGLINLNNNLELKNQMELYIELFKKAKNNWMWFEVTDWNSKKVIDELQKWNISIVWFWEKYFSEVLHWVLAIWYTKDSIIIIDPLVWEKEILFQDFDNYIETSMWKRLLSINSLNYNN